MAAMDRLRRFATPGSAACIAAFLAAAGVEVNEPLLRDVLEIAAALVAVLGFFFGSAAV
jgi:hypothetical protein